MAVQQGLIVPAYWGGGQQAKWDRVIDKAGPAGAIPKAGSVRRVVVGYGYAARGYTNVADGPTRVQTLIQNCLIPLKQRQVEVLAYIASYNGDTSQPGRPDPGDPTTTLRTVADQIDDWWQHYSGYLDGIYLDQGPQLDLGPFLDANGHLVARDDTYFHTYYSGIANSFRASLYTGPKRIALGAALFPYDWTLQVADEVMIFEGKPAEYSDPHPILPSGSGPAPAWWSQNPDRVFVVLHDVSNLSALVTSVFRARDRNVGYVFATTTSSTRYDLPTWFDEEVGLVDTLNKHPNAGVAFIDDHLYYITNWYITNWLVTRMAKHGSGSLPPFVRRALRWPGWLPKPPVGLILPGKS
jgi:hypothetical protein